MENSSLIDPKDLPFDIKDLPDVFTHFRKRVEAPDMFKPPESAPDKLLPFVEVPKVDNGPGVFKVGDDVSEESLIAQLLAPLDKEPGPLPVLGQLKGQDLPNALPFKGGETEALARLDHYFGGGKQAPAATYKDTRNEMLGADYSTKVRPIFFGKGEKMSLSVLTTLLLRSVLLCPRPRITVSPNDRA